MPLVAQTTGRRRGRGRGGRRARRPPGATSPPAARRCRRSSRPPRRCRWPGRRCGAGRHRRRAPALADRIASRWAPRATRVTGSPARWRWPPMTPPTAPAPYTTYFMSSTLRGSRTLSGARAAHLEAQVQHAVALDDDLRVVEQVLGRRRSRSSACRCRTPPARRPWPPRRRDRGRGPVRPRRPRTDTVRSPASSRAVAIAELTSSTKWYDASGCQPSGLGRCDTTTTWSPVGDAPLTRW